MTLLLACSSIVGPDDDLEDRQRQWAAQQAHDYRFEYRMSCFCPTELTQPVVINVRGDNVVSVVNARTGAVVPSYPYAHWPTVDSLFMIVRRARDQHAYRLDVDYDAQFGYPTRIDIDYVKNAIDDEVTHTASGLTRVR